MPDADELDRLTHVTVTDLRIVLRAILEPAHFYNRRYLVERNAEPFVVILGVRDYLALVQAATLCQDASGPCAQ